MALTTTMAKYSWLTFLLQLHKTRGWPYVAAWGHRISGVFLTLFLLFHVFTLSGLRNPEAFTAKMETMGSLFPPFFEWLLAIPVIFHALNGGRLVLYELFGNRQDRLLLNWVIFLSACYLLLLGTLMAAGGQSVSAAFFWSYVFVGSLILTYIVVSQLKKSFASIPWKLHRISGAVLLLMIPAHMVFMHLDPAMGRDYAIISERMGSLFIKVVDLLLLVAVVYHAAYGVRGICFDYLKKDQEKTFSTILITLAGFFILFQGVLLLITI